MLITGLFSMGQIKGTITDTSLTPVELAAIVNITRQTTSISNLDGEFVIEGTIGDSNQAYKLHGFCG